AGVDTTGLSVHDEDLTPARREVDYYLHAVVGQTLAPDDARALLDMMSGLLETEFASIEGLLDAHPGLATAEFLTQVERRFIAMRVVLASRLARLRRLIAPPAPPRPLDHW